MFAFIKNIAWLSIDAVWLWFRKLVNLSGLNASTLLIGMLCFGLFIGYVLSPYLRNPLRYESNKKNRGK